MPLHAYSAFVSFFCFSCIFVLLSREEALGVLICWTMCLHRLWRFSVPKFRLLIEISTLICCLCKFHQAKISIVKPPIRGRGLNQRPRDSGRRFHKPRGHLAEAFSSSLFSLSTNIAHLHRTYNFLTSMTLFDSFDPLRDKMALKTDCSENRSICRSDVMTLSPSLKFVIVRLLEKIGGLAG